MRRFRTLKIPQRAHPLVRELIKEMNYQRIGVKDMAQRTGVAYETMKRWPYTVTPHLANLEACFTVLGKKLKPVNND